MPKVKKETKKFRAQYKTFGLTYSKCTLTRKDLVDKLLEKIDITDYYCVQETHDPKKEGYDPLYPHHLHIWFQVASKPNIKNSNFFDIDGFHPNIGKKKRNWIWNYLKKQDTFPYTNIPEGYVGLAKAGDYKEACQRFAEEHPKEYVINLDRVHTNLRKLGRPDRVAKIYPLKVQPPEDWKSDEKSLHIIGKSGSGKTEWAKSYIDSLGKSYLYVTHIDKLKNYNGEDFLIFDDMSFNHLPRETAIHLAEVKNSSDIHCRHSPAYLPPGVGRIFTSNSYDIWPLDEFGAISRRIQIWAPDISFY